MNHTDWAKKSRGYMIRLNKLTSLFLFTIIAVLIVMFSCKNNPADEAPGMVDFTKGTSWLYQLQKADISAVKNSGFDFVVMDYSFDGKLSGEYAASDIQSLLAAGLTPVAYISIGEAENYRFYWRSNWVQTEDGNDFTVDAPIWLGHTNPDWPGNYKVRYWNSDWRDHYVKPYLDKIIAEGFSGVYLDIVDGFEYWGDRQNYGAGKETAVSGDPVDDEAEAAARMIELVKWIAAYCKSQSSFGDNFLIIPQNGVRILNYDSDGLYLNTVSGIGAEDIWYDETSKKASAEVDERVRLLRHFTAANKPVLAVDYVDDGSGFSGANKVRMLDFASKCQAEKFRYYVANSDRELNRVNVIADVQP